MIALPSFSLCESSSNCTNPQQVVQQTIYSSPLPPISPLCLHTTHLFSPPYLHSTFAPACHPTGPTIAPTCSHHCTCTQPACSHHPCTPPTFSHHCNSTRPTCSHYCTCMSLTSSHHHICTPPICSHLYTYLNSLCPGCIMQRGERKVFSAWNIFICLNCFIMGSFVVFVQ